MKYITSRIVKFLSHLQGNKAEIRRSHTTPDCTGAQAGSYRIADENEAADLWVELTL